MTTTEFYDALVVFLKSKTKLPVICSHQQARNPNTGKAVTPGATARELRHYFLITPGLQRTHAVHKQPYIKPGQMQTVLIDMIPIEINFTIAGVECNNAELRTLWSLFIRNEKIAPSKDWSILSVSDIMNSPIYEKAEWRGRLLFDCRALIYDVFIDSETDTDDSIESISGEGTLYLPTGTYIAGTFHFSNSNNTIL